MRLQSWASDEDTNLLWNKANEELHRRSLNTITKEGMEAIMDN